MTHALFVKNLQLPIGRAALTPEDTLIVVDMQYDFLPGGAFAVAEGDAVVAGIAQAVDDAHGKNAKVIFTRDYHPMDHISFLPQGGDFPPHCKQGTRGSFIVDELVAVASPDDSVVYKGYMSCADSFGAARYSEAYAAGRIRSVDPCTLALSTGAQALPCSGRLDGAVHNLNAPPDVNPLPQKAHPRMESLLHPGTVYVCGLAMDYCVLDTAVNLRAQFPDRRICIVVGLTRAAKANPGFTEGILHSTVPVEAQKVGAVLKTYNIELVDNLCSGRVQLKRRRASLRRSSNVPL